MASSETLEGSTLVVIGADDNKLSINLKELDLVEVIRAIGGKIIIKKVDSSIPPIACNNDFCDELAEYAVILALDIGKDLACTLCEDHIGEIREILGEYVGATS